MRVIDLVRRIMTAESGATAIEYALICGLIAAALIGIIGTGSAVESLWNTVATVADAM